MKWGVLVIKTLYWKINDINKDDTAIKEAAAIIREGGLVAFPTETVYGLGANALDGPAVSGIFKAKDRPADNPLIVHIAAIDDVNLLAAECLPVALKLMKSFWPGPLTLVLPKTKAVPREVSAGLNTVAVRMPDHPVALKLIAAAKVPVAAPSANRSGTPSPTTAQHVWDDLAGVIHGVLDGGATDLGVESTVLDISGETPVILRPGGVTAEQLQQIIGRVEYYSTQQDQPPRSPGIKYRHYAPRAKLMLLEGTAGEVARRTLEIINNYAASGKQIGILASAENADRYPGIMVLQYGQRDHPATAAAMLYAALRKFDAAGVDIILAEGLPESGLGRAVMDRLRRASQSSKEH
ncbi:MAG: threonylcarbamoyl-AMP synthase [Desulfotomaculum sp.]|nr:threonylcarbamoyl-AMP synthase [Desulfotomaculum sp.]